MAKLNLEGKKIVSQVKLGKVEILHFEDGTFIIVDILSDNMSAVDAGFLTEDTEDDEDDEEEEEEEAPKKKGKKAKEEEEEDEDEDEEDEDDEEDDEEDEITVDEMKADLIKGKHATKKKLAKMDEDEIGDLWDEHFGEEDEDEEDEDEDEDEEDGEELTTDDLMESDFDDLEDIIDEKDLDVDIEDYDIKDVDKLRKAVAKALGIKLKK